MNRNSSVYQLLFLLKNNVIASALAYIASILIARELGPEKFGFYSYVLVISSVASVVVNFSTDSTAGILLSKFRGDQQRVLNLYYALRLFLYLGYLIFIFILSFFDHLLGLSLFCLSLTLLNVSFLFEVNKQNVKYSYIFMGERFFYILVILSLWAFNLLELKLVFFTLLISSFLSLFVQCFLLRTFFFNFKMPNLVSIGNVIKENGYLVLVALSTLSYGGFSRIIMEQKLGLYLLGVYSAGWQLIKVGTLFQSQLDRVWRLNLSKALIEKDKVLLKSVLLKYFFLGTIPVIFGSSFIYYFSEFIVLSFYSKEYKDLVDIFGYISFYLVVINLDGLVRMLWNAVGDRKFYFFINILISLAMVFLLVFYLENDGIESYLKIVVFSHFFSVLVLFYFFIKKRYV